MTPWLKEALERDHLTCDEDGFIKTLPQRVNDLNKLRVPWRNSPTPLCDPSTTVTDAKVTSHFRNIREAVIGYIRAYPWIAGCVAWLTDEAILDALASR